ncbi:uracil-DNA glycosylase-like protein [Boletus edulis BED1]|uniref:Uracil-DNA glycosylase-like protein n=1 Tax=Boletus edulis BED1 TaxID=1328754 RepID=A0AAD4BHH9_BOLED|nr:uracil-DNA glycosylase-like protein [Boletus edulis BED1]
MQLGSTTVARGSRVECEAGELVTRKTDQEQTQAKTAKKRTRRERHTSESAGENSHHRDRRYSAKKSKQNNNSPYAHLHPLQDYLHPGLDVVFCGINPGRMSAETGHHFANPTNHFWRCLHRSGMTTTLVPPSEDFSLPERFNVGLTNLVDRPSTQACELSRAEMVDSVPAFLDKLARHRPRFVCFVGMVIWEIVRNSLAKLSQQGMKKLEKGRSKKKNQMGLQTYKLLYGNEIAGLPQETLLFVVPCTSGRVVQYQIPDKIALFTKLQTLVRMPSSEIDTSGMECVVWRSSSP